MSTEVEQLRSELKKAHRERLAINLKLKELKKQAKKKIPSVRVRQVEKPKGPSSELTVVQTAMLLGCSRDRIYRLLKEKELLDLHPYTVGQFIRPGGTIGKEPKKHERVYKKWKMKWSAYEQQVSAKKEKQAHKILLKDN